MSTEFNFDRLTKLYSESLQSFDKSFMFESKVGKGRFLFMMFLSAEDKDARDLLFLYLRNSNYMLRIKLFGNHFKGTFTAYINDFHKLKLINELMLTNQGNQSFDFNNFLDELNMTIPLTIPKQQKLSTLRANTHIVSTLNVVDNADKTVLIGERKLTKGKPRDRTLRKLYYYTEGNDADISQLIELLKSCNKTVAWTTPDRKGETTSIRELINRS